MPRCCSSRIQSEVAWRAALRPLTVPAIEMAPPNSSSFSVSVVLPASGCEMIAKVRRRAISGSSIGVSAKGSSLIDGALEYDGVLAAADCLVVAAAHANLPEPQRLVQADRRQVRRPRFEKGFGG